MSISFDKNLNKMTFFTDKSAKVRDQIQELDPNGFTVDPSLQKVDGEPIYKVTDPELAQSIFDFRHEKTFTVGGTPVTIGIH